MIVIEFRISQIHQSETPIPQSAIKRHFSLILQVSCDKNL